MSDRQDAFSPLPDAVRDLVGLLARLGSDDPGTRDAAEAELGELRARIEEGPSPGEVFLGRVAQILRDEADRLRCF
jgi:hypothetical protein